MTVFRPTVRFPLLTRLISIQSHTRGVYVMKNSPLVLAAAVAGLLAGGSAERAARAQAPAAPSFERLDVNEDGVLSGLELKSAAGRDVNGDGRVTRAEFEGASSISTVPVAGNAAEDERLFAEHDITEDGFLSGKEVKGFESLDADGDRQVTKAEFLSGRAAARRTSPAPASHSAAAKRLAEAFFRVLDENEDGRLSGTEFKPDMKPYDADGNGRITREEFVAGETSNPDADLAATAMTLLINALQTGNVSPFASMMHANLRIKVEEPVLRWVVGEIRNEYGDVKAMENLVTIDTESGGVTSEETTIEISFTKGTDKSKVQVTTVKGEVLGFNIGVPFADRLDEILYARIASDKTFAREVGEHFSARGKELVELAVSGQDEEAYGRFHPAFQKQFPLDAVRQLFAGVRGAAGAVRSIEWTGLTSQLGSDGKPLQKFSLNYDILGEKGKYHADVSFEFDGFGSTIVGVNFKKADE
jgi:hypothetical protein